MSNKMRYLRAAIAHLRKVCPPNKPTRIYFTSTKQIHEVVSGEAYIEYGKKTDKIVLPVDKGYDLTLAYLLHEWSHAVVGCVVYGHGPVFGRAYSKVFRAYYETK